MYVGCCQFGVDLGGKMRQSGWEGALYISILSISISYSDCHAQCVMFFIKYPPLFSLPHWNPFFFFSFSFWKFLGDAKFFIFYFGFVGLGFWVGCRVVVFFF